MMKSNKKVNKNKKTKIIGIDISSKIFKDTEEAVKCANNLKIFIQRFVDKENQLGNNYSAFVLIGVSENDSKNGVVTTNKTGSKGRPQKIFSNNQSTAKVKPHIHIIIYANPADMIANAVSEYITKRYGANTAWKKYVEDYCITAIKYLFKQSLIIRTVKRNSFNILNSKYFQNLVDLACDYGRFIFTKTKEHLHEKNHDENKGLSMFRKIVLLICNYLFTITTNNKVLRILQNSKVLGILQNMKDYSITILLPLFITLVILTTLLGKIIFLLLLLYFLLQIFLILHRLVHKIFFISNRKHELSFTFTKIFKRNKR